MAPHARVSDSQRLRIAVVHSYYSSRVPSGENVVVDLQVAALRTAGHEVELFAVRQDEVETAPSYNLRTAARVATNRGRSPRREIDEFAPDIVHVHNLFPNFGRTWLRHYADRTVATLHNFRPICAAATLYRDGHPCTECPDAGNAMPALRHRCFKGSVAATLPIVVGARMGDDPVLRFARQIVVLNETMRAQYEAVGVPRDRLQLVPNFVADPGPPASDGHGPWLYAGRLAPEKGILELVRSWPVGVPLVVVGSGPLEDDVRRIGNPSVDLRGTVSPAEVRLLMATARGLVFPSLWPEGLPTVYLEALSAGTPVLASPQSVVGALVAAEGTGRVLGADVAADVAAAEREFPTLRSRCRSVFEQRYGQSAWISSIAEVYALAMQSTDGLVDAAGR